jgi:2-polyprenyl-3-methyl-5-hydroxy-6-metoxy-1,4-benzoquinol methylase
VRPLALREIQGESLLERHLYKALRIPFVYRRFARLVVGDSARTIFANEHIRAREGQRLLDVGCGPADILRHLPRVDYTGFDANPDYIATASTNYGSDRVRFHCQRVSDEVISTQGEFDIVLAIAILHHIDDAEAEHLFRLAYAALRPGGRLVTLDCAYVSGQSPIARFLISRDRGQHVRDERGYLDVARRVFSRVDRVVRHDLMRIPYTHLILECTK